MNSLVKRPKFLLLFFVLIFLTSCATRSDHSNKNNSLAYIADKDETLIRRYLPVFIIANHTQKYNLIGTPSARITRGTKEEVFINADHPSIYTEIRKFNTRKDSYTNLLYRIHFEKVPFSLFPFHIGWGENVGLIVVVTLNSGRLPVLYTIVHTCGCYLSFIPTSYTSMDAFPDGWNKDRQSVYSESLPGLLDFGYVPMDQAVTAIFIKTGSHRVEDIFVSHPDHLKGYHTRKVFIKPLYTLQHLPLKYMDSTSFYDNSKHRNGYVKGSFKPWERLLMSWWALDFRVGEDKKLGTAKDDSPVFYTSLKPWARDDSDMRDFKAFLKYWGWKL